MRLPPGFLRPLLRRTMSTAPPPPLSLPHHPLFRALANHPPTSAAVTHTGTNRTYTYGNLLRDISATRQTLLPTADLASKRIAVLVENSYEFVVTFLSILASNGIAVPLCTSHPLKEQLHVLNDSIPAALITSALHRPRSEELAKTAGTELLHIPAFAPPAETPAVSQSFHDTPGTQPALIIYTSGTTSLPKGVLSTHRTLAAQTSSLQTTWHLTPADTILHVLPMHHVHGIVNAMLLPLLAGSSIEFAGSFEKQKVWDRLTSAEVSIFMGVPTMYSRLLERAAVAGGKPKSRLNISGSAALPETVRREWREAGGGELLERYGMTEIGMALSHTLERRLSGSVGWPLPGVSVRLAADSNGETEGEVQVRGDSVFREYWNKPELTKKEFTEDGWFKTGDIARVGEEGEYYILGRRSADIIKTGGEKVSALEVERELLETGKVEECAVVGVKDVEWGQKVVAIVVLKPGVQWSTEEMRKELKGRSAVYKIPREMKLVDQVPRNVMGKVNKKMLVKELFGEGA